MASLDALDSSERRANEDRKDGEPGILEQARVLLNQLSAQAQDHVSLAALETRRAGEALIKAVVMSLLAVCVLLVAWLVLVAAALITFAQNQWLSPLGGMLLVAAIHGFCALWLVIKIRVQTRLLMFPATLNSFAKHDGGV